MRHPFHWNANNQKQYKRKRSTIQRCYHKEQGYSNRKRYQLKYDKHTNNATSLHLFGIKEKRQH